MPHVEPGDVAWVLTSTALVLLKLRDLPVGLRVSREHEGEGLDIVLHGEQVL